MGNQAEDADFCGAAVAEGSARDAQSPAYIEASAAIGVPARYLIAVQVDLDNHAWRWEWKDDLSAMRVAGEDEHIPIGNEIDGAGVVGEEESGHIVRDVLEGAFVVRLAFVVVIHPGDPEALLGPDALIVQDAYS